MPKRKLKTKRSTALRVLCGGGIHGDWEGGVSACYHDDDTLLQPK